VLRHQTRPGDLLGRWGGEEFILLLHPPVIDVHAIGERIRQAVGQVPMSVEGVPSPVNLTVSIGGTTFDPNGKEPGGLDIALIGADRNLYKAKKEGRNRVCV
jgi:diguanylate cyclase (GGDEF)-like protein